MTNQSNMEKLNLTPKEASLLIGCSEYTIKELARMKKIPHHRVGNLIKFTREGLKEWIEQQEKKSIDR